MRPRWKLQRLQRRCPSCSSAARRQNGHRSSRAEHRITYGSRCGRRSRPSRNSWPRRHQPRRSRRHRAAQRPADDRVVPGRVGRRNGGAAESRVQGRRVPLLPRGHRRARADSSARRRRRSAARRRRSRADPHDRHGRRGHVQPAAASSAQRKPVSPPPDADDVALVLHTSGSTGRPSACRSTHANLSISARQRRAQLRAGRRRCVAVRDAAVSRARPRGVDAGHAARPAARSSCRRSSARCRSGASPAITASRGIRRCRRSISCCWRARQTTTARRPAGAEQPALHPFVQRVAAAAGDARRSKPRSARRCSRPTA